MFGKRRRGVIDNVDNTSKTGERKFSQRCQTMMENKNGNNGRALVICSQ